MTDTGVSPGSPAPGGDVRFEVADVFDIAGRGGLLAVGGLSSGVVRRGMTLRNETTGSPVRVLAVELAPVATPDTGRRTLVIDRADAEAVQPGAVLIG